MCIAGVSALTTAVLQREGCERRRDAGDDRPATLTGVSDEHGGTGTRWPRGVGVGGWVRGCIEHGRLIRGCVKQRRRRWRRKDVACRVCVYKCIYDCTAAHRTRHDRCGRAWLQLCGQTSAPRSRTPGLRACVSAMSQRMAWDLHLTLPDTIATSQAQTACRGLLKKLNGMLYGRRCAHIVNCGLIGEETQKTHLP